jgi:carbon-monoxide dehydrogenase medium subunit
METALARGWSADALKGLSGNASDMITDIHGDAAYRAHLVGVMARRAVVAAG